MKTAIIIGGPAGCGKSTIAEEISKKFCIPFLEGDSLHSKENIDKMSRNIPLKDEDRWVWLESIVSEIKEILEKSNAVVVTCSALKKSYRDILRSSNLEIDTKIIILNLTFEDALKRVSERTSHYMKAAMVESQFHDFELPVNEKETVVLETHLLDKEEVVKDTFYYVGKWLK